MTERSVISTAIPPFLYVDLEADIHVGCRNPAPNAPVLPRRFAKKHLDLIGRNAKDAQILHECPYSAFFACSDRPLNMSMLTSVN
jgi:hypothetical protein